MFDPGICAGMTLGTPRVSTGALHDLHRLLQVRGFRYDAQRPLQVIRVDGHVRIGEKSLEPDPPFAYIVERLDKRVGGREPLALELPIDPLEEQLHERFAVAQPM
jgi:hypothetical protein